MEAVRAVFSYLSEKKQQTTIQTLLKMSRLPTKAPKTFENFDFSLLKGKDVERLRVLPSLNAIYSHRNLAFIGPAGTGKTHLAQAFGYPTVDSTADRWTGTSFTAVTPNLYYNGDHLGILSIPSIGLNVKVYQGTDSAALRKGAGHFSETSIWDGNVCLAGHNRGVNNHFGKIHTLKTGNIITYTTELGTRSYTVRSVSKVLYIDTSGTCASDENCLTLYTCVMDQPSYRWMVRAAAQ